LRSIPSRGRTGPRIVDTRLSIRLAAFRSPRGFSSYSETLLEAIGDERRACAFLARSCLYRYLIDDRVYNGKKTRPKLVFGADVALKEAESRLEREPTCDYRLEALERAYNALIRRGIRRRAFAVKKTLEGYTTREIAEMEGVDMKAIQGRLTHFYEQVRDEEAFLRGRAKSKEETK